MTRSDLAAATREAAEAGFNVLVVTVDIPVGAKRDKELKNGLILPFSYTPSIIAQTITKPGWLAETLPIATG